MSKNIHAKRVIGDHIDAAKARPNAKRVIGDQIDAGEARPVKQATIATRYYVKRP